MIEVLPGIIPSTYNELKEKVAMVRGLVLTVQLDVVDGFFAPQATWPYRLADDPDFARLLSGHEQLPFQGEIDYELDMMVSQPENQIESWLKVGIASAVIHIDSTDKMSWILETLNRHEVKAGIGIKPRTAIKQLKPFIEQADFIQVMGNDHIGFNGVALDERVYTKIANLRLEYPNIKIGLDIGVTKDNASEITALGVTKLVSGSTIYNSPSPKEMIEYLKHCDES